MRGLGSGIEYPADQLMNLDPADGRPVEMVIDIKRLKREQPDCAWYKPERNDMWRFGGLLGLDSNDAGNARWITSGGEGATPLLEYADYPLAKKVGFRLQVKEEGRPVPGYGANPTLSFKDRGMAMVVSMARLFGLDRLTVPTQGNAGDSLADYAVRAGLAAAIVMPDDTPMPVLGRVAALARMHERIELDLVQGTIREAGQLMKEKYLPRGYFNVATFQEPGWRIEGKKTLGLELAEPVSAGSRWELPDVIVYPTGGGTGLLGMWKAFDELQALGLIDSRRPRMVAVQSDETAPLVEAMTTGADDTAAVAPGHTIATGLNVPGGIGHFRVLQILRASDGVAVSVSEQEIATSVAATWRDKGWWISPEGAASFAALPQLAQSGVVQTGQRVVCVNTASLEKYLPGLRHLLV
ncbi:MAG: threonine synthase [Gammaproteobacteria bacterium]|nr:threonine synthase [Gammaproteobacteria bacterium]NNF61068.1 threonine synthase [Gammaproteobacteria bacterium]NNM21419.1 threonine synthase [Gammaproteobacteria bacterium]